MLAGHVDHALRNSKGMYRLYGFYILVWLVIIVLMYLVCVLGLTLEVRLPQLACHTQTDNGHAWETNVVMCSAVT